MAHKLLSSLLVGATVLALSCSAQARDGYDAMEDQLLQNGSTGAQPQGFGPGSARDGWRAHDHWERHHDEGRWGHQRWDEDEWDPEFSKNTGMFDFPNYSAHSFQDPKSVIH